MDDIVKDQKEYFERGNHWEADIYRRTKRSNKVAWTITTISTGVACLAIFALAAIAPLKTVVPYIVEVDRISGEVNVKRPLDETPIPQKEALDKFFLHKYLQARIGFDRNSFNHQYRTVVAMSNNQVAHQYAKFVDLKNEEGPVKRYGDHGFAKVDVREINFIAENTALIRFTLKERLANQREISKEGNATITYAYDKSPKREEIRLITPLGFGVKSYRVDPVLALNN